MPFLPRLLHPGIAGQSNKTFLALTLKCVLYSDCSPLKRGWSRITLASTQRNREERGERAQKWKGYGGQDKLPCWKHGTAFKISFPEHPFLLAGNIGKFSHSWSFWSIQVWTAYIHQTMQALRIGAGVSACHSPCACSPRNTWELRYTQFKEWWTFHKPKGEFLPQRLYSLDQQSDSTVRQHRHMCNQ